jgi:hypothetical protein
MRVAANVSQRTAITDSACSALTLSQGRLDRHAYDNKVFTGEFRFFPDI